MNGGAEAIQRKPLLQLGRQQLLIENTHLVQSVQSHGGTIGDELRSYNLYLAASGGIVIVVFRLNHGKAWQQLAMTPYGNHRGPGSA